MRRTYVFIRYDGQSIVTVTTPTITAAAAAAAAARSLIFPHWHRLYQE